MSEKAPSASEAPRMTPALTEALKTFENDSRRAPENKDALRALKREDFPAYVDHLSVMSDKEAAGDIDSGRFYSNRLLYEDTKESVSEIISPKLDQAKYMGVRALELSGVVMAGIAGKIDDKVLAIRMEHGAHREKKRTAKLEAWQEKEREAGEKWLAKRNARRERLKVAVETVTSPYRRISRGVLSLYARGLEASDPAKASELRDKIRTQRETERLVELDTTLEDVDISVQSPNVQRLLSTDVYSPEAVCTLENGAKGFVSAQFESADTPHSQFALFYGKLDANDTQLTPVMLEKRKGHAWTIQGMIEGQNYGTSHDTLYSSILRGMAKMDEGINPVVSKQEIELIRSFLSPARPERIKNDSDQAIATSSKHIKELDEALKTEKYPLKKRALLDKRAKALADLRRQINDKKKSRTTTKRAA